MSNLALIQSIEMNIARTNEHIQETHSLLKRVGDFKEKTKIISKDIAEFERFLLAEIGKMTLENKDREEAVLKSKQME